MPEVRLTETISVSQHEISDEEKLLAAKYNRLVDRCLEWSLYQMRVGMESTRLAISKSVIASASRLAALETKTQTEVQRVAFQNLLQEMTMVNHAPTPALTVQTVDQD
jgi:hypothetical protein